MNIKISVRKISKILLSIVLFLTVASLSGQLIKYSLGYDNFLGFIPLFHVDKEANIPTWYSSVSLFLCSGLLAIIALAKHREINHYAKHWIGLSLIFLFLSIDEAASIHELTILPLRTALNTSGIFYFAWVIPGAVLVLIFLLSYFKFFLDLHPLIKQLFIVSISLYLGGALGMELVGGWYREIHGPENLIYANITAIEELLEMSGILVFIYTLILYLEMNIKQINIFFDG